METSFHAFFKVDLFINNSPQWFQTNFNPKIFFTFWFSSINFSQMFWSVRSCCLYVVCTLSVLWWFLNSLSVLSWRRWTACLSPPSRSRWAQVFLWAWCVVLSEAQVILNVCFTRRWRSGAAPRCRARRWRCVFSLLWPSHRTSSCWTPWVRPSLLFSAHGFTNMNDFDHFMLQIINPRVILNAGLSFAVFHNV